MLADVTRKDFGTIVVRIINEPACMQLADLVTLGLNSFVNFWLLHCSLHLKIWLTASRSKWVVDSIMRGIFVLFFQRSRHNACGH